MATFHCSIHGVNLFCELDYEPGQEETAIDPRIPAQAELYSAFVAGVQIYALLSEDVVTQIEEAFLAQQREGL